MNKDVLKSIACISCRDYAGDLNKCVHEPGKPRSVKNPMKMPTWCPLREKD